MLVSIRHTMSLHLQALHPTHALCSSCCTYVPIQHMYLCSVCTCPAYAKCLQALHRNHSPPSGCYITGDPSVGYAMHLRALDATANEVNKMRKFTDLCNAGASVIARGAASVTMLGQSTTGQLFMTFAKL